MGSTNSVRRRRLFGALLALLSLLAWAPPRNAEARSEGPLVVAVGSSSSLIGLQAQDPPTCTPREDCCKVCSKGKACGNSCIRADYNCHKGVGCACDAEDVCD